MCWPSYSHYPLHLDIPIKEAPKEKVLVIGASSGIGEITAKFLDEMDRYNVCITARSEDKLKAIKQTMTESSSYATLDITAEHSVLKEKLTAIFKEMQGVDCVILTAGGLTEITRKPTDKKLPRRQINLNDINLNLIGCLNVMHIVKKLFKKQEKGHLIVTTSVGDIRGNYRLLGYGAAKCGISYAVEAFDQKFRTTNSNIKFSEVVVGITVPKEQIKGAAERFSSQSFEDCALDLYNVMITKEKKTFSPGRWFYLAQVIKWLPESAYDAIANNPKFPNDEEPKVDKTT